MKDVCVKAKSKLSRLLDDDLLENLLKEDDLLIKIEYLKSKYEFLSSCDKKLDVENALYNDFYKQIKSLEYFLRDVDNIFFKKYFSIFRIYLIQEIITSIVNGSLELNYSYFINSPFFYGFVLKENYSIKDFVKSIDDNHIRRVLEPFINKNMDQELLIFLSSNSLIKSYYRDLLKLSDKFSRDERKLIKRFISEEINLENFQMLYRLKSFFEINDADIFNYLIEGGYLFNGQRLRELSNLNKNEFLEYFSSSKYKDIFKDQDLFYKNIQDRKTKLYKDEIINEKSDVLYCISAINLLYIDLKNIICMIEMGENYTYEDKKELVIGR